MRRTMMTMNTMNEMVAGMVGGIVMANGGKVEYDIPNTRKRISIVVEDREPTDEEKREDIADFLTNEVGLTMTEPNFDEPVVCLTLDEMLTLMDRYRTK
jgi:hypothetical protein